MTTEEKDFAADIKRIAVALEKIAENTTPESDEEIRAKIQGFRTGGQ